MQSTHKCTTDGCNTTLNYQSAIVIADNNVQLFYRCTECFMGYQFSLCGTPIMVATEPDPPSLVSMDGNGNYNYFKCHREGSDYFTLVADVGNLVTVERLEALGLKVIATPKENESRLPAFRLHKMV